MPQDDPEADVPLVRQQGDQQLLKALANEGFAGPRYVRFREELARYGISVLQAWMCTGWVFTLTARRGFDLSPTDSELAELAQNGELRWDLATMTVALTLPRFRDQALVGGRWQPTAGASIATYFMGACLNVFPNEYRSHRTAAKRWNRARDLSATWAAEPHGDIDPVLASLHAEEKLRSLDPRTRVIVVLTLQGYAQQEIAEILNMSSAKAVEGVLYRLRQQTKLDRKGEGDV
ncbi:RNA polymerase sigma factor [Streptomyces sp. 2A115]|uniref:RNA polymerase sigma factor n=1 Tax=Streptomyces sp. 2A115 TaxID=3457439 RepID=UPI003FD2470F